MIKFPQFNVEQDPNKRESTGTSKTPKLWF